MNDGIYNIAMFIVAIWFIVTAYFAVDAFLSFITRLFKGKKEDD